MRESFENDLLSFRVDSEGYLYVYKEGMEHRSAELQRRLGGIIPI